MNTEEKLMWKSIGNQLGWLALFLCSFRILVQMTTRPNVDECIVAGELLNVSFKYYERMTYYLNKLNFMGLN